MKKSGSFLVAVLLAVVLSGGCGQAMVSDLSPLTPVATTPASTPSQTAPTEDYSQLPFGSTGSQPVASAAEVASILDPFTDPAGEESGVYSRPNTTGGKVEQKLTFRSKEVNAEGQVVEVVRHINVWTTFNPIDGVGQAGMYSDQDLFLVKTTGGNPWFDYQGNLVVSVTFDGVFDPTPEEVAKANDKNFTSSGRMDFSVTDQNNWNQLFYVDWSGSTSFSLGAKGDAGPHSSAVALTTTDAGLGAMRFYYGQRIDQYDGRTHFWVSVDNVIDVPDGVIDIGPVTPTDVTTLQAQIDALLAQIAALQGEGNSGGSSGGGKG